MGIDLILRCHPSHLGPEPQHIRTDIKAIRPNHRIALKDKLSEISLILQRFTHFSPKRRREIQTCFQSVLVFQRDRITPCGARAEQLGFHDLTPVNSPYST